MFPPFSKTSLNKLLKRNNSETIETESTISSQPISSGDGSSSSVNFRTRVQLFQDLLAEDVIRIRDLRKLSFNGIPESGNLRAIVWKLLLGYLPGNKAKWEEELAAKRKQYKHFCEELILDPKKFNGVSALEASLRHANLEDEKDAGADLSRLRSEVTDDDHPLCQKQDSKWNTFFKDSEVLEQIDRDVMRTHPDMHFFSGSDGAAVVHREEMKRALFIFAKLNPGLTYVQGMNELYAPLYYLFKSDTNTRMARHAEADAFYCFVELISEFRDNFCQQLDNSSVGVRAVLNQFSALLENTDWELWQHLNLNKVSTQFYAFRWITLLLTQEFPFPDLLRLWDSLLSDPAGRFDFLMRLCLSMLLNVRHEILEGDFSTIIKMLQRYPPTDISILLHTAAQLNR